MKFGYARASKADQDLSIQTDALQEYGADIILEEKLCGTREKPVLQQLLNKLDEGDTLVIYALNCLGRTVKQMMNLIDDFKAAGIILVSLQEDIDTSSILGKRVLDVLSSLTQMEREVIAERTQSGLEEAKKKGREAGRRPVDEKKIEKALKLYYSDELSVPEICVMTRISKATLYKYINLYVTERNKALRNVSESEGAEYEEISDAEKIL